MARHLTRRPPRAHWLLLTLGALALMAALVLHGTVSGVGAEGAPVTGSGPPAGLDPAAPVVRISGDGTVGGAAMPAGTVALTFDDGPDPRWTPRVLDVLRRHGARATFFVVGAKVNRYPDLARRIVAEGHELGVHTFTHADLDAVPRWRLDLELDLTRNAVAAATGRSVRLMRPPYSGTPEVASARDLAAMRSAAAAGYLVVLTDRDTGDWRRPGVDAIVAAASGRAPGAGAVVMMHDSGGDREQTVTALDRLLSTPSGARYVTVSEGLGIADADPAPDGDVVRGTALRWSQTAARWTVTTMGWLMVVAVLLAGLRLLVLLPSAWAHARASRRRPDRLRYVGTVSVVVPAYNEALNIAGTVRSLLANDYPAIEVVVVDDGSTDDTAAIVEGLGVTLIRQVNRGKPTAINAGVRAASGGVVVLVDGDTVFEPDTIGRLVQPFVDPEVGAVSGNAKVANRTGILGRWQHLEYVVGFNLDRRMFDVARCMPTIPGAIGAFRRRVLAEVGGVPSDTLAEDTDLTMAVIRAGWRVVHRDNAIAWTEVPLTLKQLWRQRYRWCYGTMQAMWKHRRAVLRRGAEGRLGRRGLTYLTLFQILLPLTAPAVDVFAVYGLLFGSWSQVLGVWCGFVAVQAVTAAYALRLDREPLGPLWTVPLQQFVYRQFLYLVVVQSTVAALLGGRERWQAMARTGIGPLPETPARRPAS
ncbi:bifunctional polysaccharide deacetylase/glycosyltransferase family 2 protein [Virgisporangium ochraceum]|uniref:Bi-functional transferase/deacetylase n=1 Tax=Virgisporangium ochraceum TaxID=65505 RepID=A0A8J4A1P4_9ACTN|nr:bifunctional polysaccharide deacetylase/glycosyltransferase family 2 protein [Virgisporangium ochraceum]GIJ72225.1 bi-functional transferase/deacetylase [Virgisporangium ochraceum]